ncbi:hypothetical protein [Polynucleobacter sp. AP-Latsch-80-C2]|jgi:hypothetical protein|uniref:hypothetical protein n=1 Tax=Polynucleobacter sp. AP-Latsch-80-C2 TaxID=2576931 RepID=UPI001C0C98EC|nr:hypothetical protein [Polynucleobacter sp. AP-Latsch-80-C2]MBU3624181.1 hypothetical protein [Polynucleobacter sp. AP-Latsch-80-C2]
MNSELKKYLSDVFRKEVQITSSQSFLSSGKKVQFKVTEDRNTQAFILDGKYRLRLDEII